MSFSTGKYQKQQRLGPAPFASFDQSEDLSSPESKGYEPMPEIYEGSQTPLDQETFSASTSTAQTPTTPRIDVEQASSPSQEDSVDSIPEREIFGFDPTGNLSLDFLEGDNDMELRYSSEDFRVPYPVTDQSVQSPFFLATGHVAKSRKVSWDAGDLRLVDVTLERKGSGGFVKRTDRESSPGFPGPRDTRLSSVSSVLSGTSGMSGLSVFSRRSPSPHRMLLETSFCGPKTDPKQIESLNETEPRRPSIVTILFFHF